MSDSLSLVARRHATLAATIVLFSLFPELQHFTYDTLKGPIQANRLSDGSVEAGLLISKQPSKLPASEEEHAKQAVARACSFQVEDIVDFQKAQSNSLSEENLLVVLRPEVDLKSLSVDTEQLVGFSIIDLGLLFLTFVAMLRVSYLTEAST